MGASWRKSVKSRGWHGRIALLDLCARLCVILTAGAKACRPAASLPALQGQARPQDSNTQTGVSNGSVWQHSGYCSLISMKLAKIKLASSVFTRLGMQVHAKIRENPVPAAKEEKKYTSQPKRKAPKLTYEERKQKLKVGAAPVLDGLIWLGSQPCNVCQT